MRRDRLIQPPRTLKASPRLAAPGEPRQHAPQEARRVADIRPDVAEPHHDGVRWYRRSRDAPPALLEAGGAQLCAIGRLNDDETREMAAACAAAGSRPAESVTAVVRDSEGLPLLVEGLLATGDLGGVEPRFGGTVRARLARLGARQRTVVSAAAVLGRQFDCGCWNRRPASSGRTSSRRCTGARPCSWSSPTELVSRSAMR